MADEEAGTSLQALVTGVLQGLMEAKRLGDLESTKLAETYRKEKQLSSFPVPAFSIADVELELRFAIVGPAEEREEGSETPDIRVIISPDALKELEPHQVSLMKLKLSPISMRVFEEGS